jgi:hypothetical protein
MDFIRDNRNMNTPIDHKSVYYIIEKWVKENRPFALIRFGDGEGIFSNIIGSVSQYYNVSMKHWGEMPSRKYKLAIESSIKDAYDQCDIAGLPFGFSSSKWSATLEGFLNRKSSKTKIKCGAEIHIEMDKTNFLLEIVSGRSVVFVGCRDITAKMEEFGAADTEIINISEQYRFATIKPKVPFYKQVASIEERMKERRFDGKICLLAAGVAGKRIGIIMRDNGGMVIDIGSIVDYWHGIKSRGWIKKSMEKKNSYTSTVVPVNTVESGLVVKQINTKPEKVRPRRLQKSDAKRAAIINKFL